jgi:peptide chain release factor 2
MSQIRAILTPFEAVDTRLTDAHDLLELLAEEPDEDLTAELETETNDLEEAVAGLELRTMLQGRDDRLDAILTIHPGAGGTESQDWAEMLMRMYNRWAERRGYTVTVLDLIPGEEAGIKSVSLQIRGEYAFGYLKAEKGVHRLVRISPFDSQARRHTSFASVFVYPDIDDTIEIEIRDEDVRMDVYRASGAGGQHVNKTSSAVRLTHEPTGIVAACQQERSQLKNRTTAMKMLRAALYQKQLEEQEAAKAVLEASKGDNAWGNQIRSYVFQPYTMVNDHRTELKISDVHKVMDGDLDELITAYLKRFGGKAA